MTIAALTLTGIDRVEDIPALNALFKKYPFVEFGILFSNTRGGQPRYPDLATTKALIEGLNAPIALHICGRAIHEFVGQIEGAPVNEIADHPKILRVQINANLNTLSDGVDDLNARLEAVSRDDRRLIVPDNDENHDLVRQLTGEHVQVLFDRSGGRGQLPVSWPAPIEDRLCGYAGGLQPERIIRDLIDIECAATYGETIWVDLESGLRDRDTDQFEIDRANIVCEAVDFLSRINLQRIMQTVTVHDLVKHIAGKPGASWVSTLDDIKIAMAEMVVIPGISR